MLVRTKMNFRNSKAGEEIDLPEDQARSLDRADVVEIVAVGEEYDWEGTLHVEGIPTGDRRV